MEAYPVSTLVNDPKNDNPEGVRRLAAAHPDVVVYCAALERELNAQGYILPGLGDAGDRLFGTRSLAVTRTTRADSRAAGGRHPAPIAVC